MFKKSAILFFCLVVSITGCSASTPELKSILNKPKSTSSISIKKPTPVVKKSTPNVNNNHSNTAAAAAPDWVHMFNEQNGYGESLNQPVMVTSNGGKTWINVTPLKGVSVPDINVSGYFLNAQIGWAFKVQRDKSLTVFGTHDGGQSWSQLATVPIKYGDGGWFVAFSDAQHGWFEEETAGMHTALSGELFATSDGGKTWQRVASVSYKYKFDKANDWVPVHQGNLPFTGSLSAQKDGTLWLIGAGIQKSTDGGRTWSPEDLPLLANQKTEDISTPVFFGNSDGVIIVQFKGGNWVLYTTRDGGRTWSFHKFPLVLRGSGVVYNFISNREGWMINNGDGPKPAGKVLYVTQDGGHSWQTIPISNALKNRFIKEMDFVDSKVGWITYNQGTVPGLAKSTNGGIS
ncbi:BNR repeat [Acididesulfobacillus acetoxydans]|uniref:BNR repeat n=1 Tax=Acididesulfobacillus acetoxydans TaxID=1561005 RepID=A0A8S0WVK9_9FIRM|nr:sialidase family protein [Acididesulfobacillus acetoxydans]CAA7599671.1 BNR repeat [Acididesulfobacillus acetoxydans]CEJ06223.1 Prokaryotic membrane lipoprotein lipid attachment site profile [Acididesulfobacillus acetoxydans]